MRWYLAAAVGAATVAVFIALPALGFPTMFVLFIGLMMAATDILLWAFDPVTMIAAAATYGLAIAFGLVAFNVIDFSLSIV